MKLGVATVGILMLGTACSAANVQYASALQACIRDARDAGTSELRLAKYNACADALDKDGGK
jgi:hypothetical protein